MATEAYVIEQVRRRVADYKEPRAFENPFYADAVVFALAKLNTDYGETYATVPDIPVNRVFLLTKLATIEMCHIRASDSFDQDSANATKDISQLSVPDLSISSPAESTTSSGDHWLQLARDLQTEYDNELEQSGGQSNTAEIQVGTLHRVSLTHGGYANRKLDEGPSAVIIIASVDGTTVNISWDALYINDFGSYNVYRGRLANMSDEERIKIIGDNHIVEHDDESLASGTYYYRVKVMNPNELTSNSNIATAVIP